MLLQERQRTSLLEFLYNEDFFRSSRPEKLFFLSLFYARFSINNTTRLIHVEKVYNRKRFTYYHMWEFY